MAFVQTFVHPNGYANMNHRLGWCRARMAQAALGDEGGERGCAGEEAQWEFSNFSLVNYKPQVALKKNKACGNKTKSCA